MPTVRGYYGYTLYGLHTVVAPTVTVGYTLTFAFFALLHFGLRLRLPHPFTVAYVVTFRFDLRLRWFTHGCPTHWFLRVARYTVPGCPHHGCWLGYHIGFTLNTFACAFTHVYTRLRLPLVVRLHTFPFVVTFVRSPRLHTRLVGSHTVALYVYLPRFTVTFTRTFIYVYVYITFGWFLRILHTGLRYVVRLLRFVYRLVVYTVVYTGWFYGLNTFGSHLVYTLRADTRSCTYTHTRLCYYTRWVTTFTRRTARFTAVYGYTAVLYTGYFTVTTRFTPLRPFTFTFTRTVYDHTHTHVWLLRSHLRCILRCTGSHIFRLHGCVYGSPLHPTRTFGGCHGSHTG